MKKDIKAAALPSIEAPLKVFAGYLRAARQARQWTVAEAASRAVVSPATYKRLEAGDPSVSFGTWAAALFQMQLLDQVIAAAAPGADTLGQAMRELNAVQRVRTKSKAAGHNDDRYDF